MDLINYARVLRRFWPILVVGCVLAVVLSVLSTARITPHGLQYRKSEIWQSESFMLLTQPGFPWGRTVLPPGTDLSQFSSLVDLYAQFANSDSVVRALHREGVPKTWDIHAAQASAADASLSGSLPVLALFGTAPSAGDALKAVRIGSKAFLTYVDAQQRAAGIPLSQRVQIQVLQVATPPKVVVPRKKTLPIVVFLAMITLTVALIFVLDNVRPRQPAMALATGETLRVSQSALPRAQRNG
jgi:hypothetical protein